MKLNTDDKREQDSLVPLQLDRLTIEEEVATMNRGKGAQLLSVAIIVSVFAVGGAWLMKTMDRSQAEGQAGAAVAGLREQHLDAYLRCVMPEAPAAVFSNSERLHSAIEGLAERYQKAYARTLESCEPRLAGLLPSLAMAPVAGKLEPTVEGLKSAAISVQDSAEDLRGYLSDPHRAYDYVEVTAFIDRLARAAVAYQKQDQALREQLTH
jgi:hypothetical protein